MAPPPMILTPETRLRRARPETQAPDAKLPSAAASARRNFASVILQYPAQSSACTNKQMLVHSHTRSRHALVVLVTNRSKELNTLSDLIDQLVLHLVKKKMAELPENRASPSTLTPHGDGFGQDGNANHVAIQTGDLFCLINAARERFVVFCCWSAFS